MAEWAAAAAEFVARKPAMVSVHLAASAVAFALGVAVFSLAKGRRLHRALGYGFVAAIVVAATSGLFVYEITGGLNPFHALSVFTLITIGGGVAAIRRARTRTHPHARARARAAHASRMAWCFAALVIAAFAEATRLTPLVPDDARAFGLTGGRLDLAIVVAVVAVCWAVIALLVARRAHVGSGTRGARS